VVGDSGAGEIEGAETGALGEKGRVGIDGPGDLEGALSHQGGTKF
jgi:hypothetical protein